MKKVKYIGGQDEGDPQKWKLKLGQVYTVSHETIGVFRGGKRKAYYLDEMGNKCAYSYHLFEDYEPLMRTDVPSIHELFEQKVKLLYDKPRN